MTSGPPAPVLVVGAAGIAGPAVAIALQQVGVPAVLVERHQHPAHGTGSFITLGTNGLRALEVIGATDVASALGFATAEITLHSGTGKRLGTVRITGSEGTPVSRTARRGDLYARLSEAATARGVATIAGAQLV